MNKADGPGEMSTVRRKCQGQIESDQNMMSIESVL